MVEIIQVETPSHYEMLITPAESVTFPLNKEVEQAVGDLKAMFKEVKGVGLAAPQINVNYRFFVIEVTEEAAAIRENGQSYPNTLYFNPKYSPVGDEEKCTDFEGCFSVGDICGWVPRYREILFEAYNEKGEKVAFKASGHVARVLQHETDHTDGVLITHRLTKDCVQGPFKEMLQKRRESLSPEKREVFDAICKEQKIIDEP